MRHGREAPGRWWPDPKLGKDADEAGGRFHATGGRADVEEQIKALPVDLRREVEDFVAFLIATRLKRPRILPDFRWAGALRELRARYTSTDLQHAISEWRLEAP